ncbi:ABC transporter permease [Clostridium aminobutyricum]|uniref:ABC transporter permease n=1 Tax=Clostridium aminobutyricum TaxID=33953 RepID=A0A939D6B3_CLOAM|nr:ABC transporter permease [Clostridium aminobutyricum]MBN7771826.1 ABC transporter permease [Clostridium aminobutyricum]
MNRRLQNKNIMAPALVFILLLAIWECWVDLKGIPLYLLPSPSKIALSLISERGDLSLHAAVTLEETIIGLVIAFLFGLLIAVLMDRFSLFRKAVYPLLVVSQTIPVIVLAPIFILYLGFGLAPKILIVVLMCFFPIVINFADGMGQVDINQVNLVRLFGAGEWKVYTMIKIPAAASSMFSGLKIAATYSITGAVVGEWLSSNSGLGYYMLRAKNGFMLDKVFACVVVIVILSLCMNGLIKLLEYAWMPHCRTEKTKENGLNQI